MATIIVAAALAAVSEIVFPLLFTGVLAVVFKPLVAEPLGRSPTARPGTPYQAG